MKKHIWMRKTVQIYWIQEEEEVLKFHDSVDMEMMKNRPIINV